MPLDRRTFLRGAVAAAAWPTRAAERPPNILLILADDLGIGDLPAYNPDSRIPLPHLQRLAAEGLLATDAYCPDAVCTPTRYALLTGRYGWRTKHPNGVLGNWEPALIEPGRLTLPALLRQAGYHTGGFGKWHLGAGYATLDGQPPIGLGAFITDNDGANVDFGRPLVDGPLARGFDRWYGFICASEGVVYDQDRAVAVLADKAVPASPTLAGARRLNVSEYLPEITERTVEYLEQRAAAARAGQPFFAYFAPYVPHIPLAVADEFRGLTNAGDYGDYVHELDHFIGRLLATLDRHGLTENTLVLFASDNGSQWPTTGEGHQPNAPFRGTKWMVLEGGVRTPLLARWPARIAPGRRTAQLIALTDLLATLAALVGRELPPGAGEDSHNLLPVLLGTAGATGRESVVVKASGPLKAIRRGTWKYIDGRGNGRGAGPTDAPPAQLYDLAADPGERANLYLARPALAAELKAELDRLVKGPTSAPGR